MSKQYIDLVNGNLLGDLSQDRDGNYPADWSNNQFDGRDSNLLTSEVVTNLYLYGTMDQPLHVEDRLRSKEDAQDTLHVRIDMKTYMENGPGKLADLAETDFAKYMFSSTEIDELKVDSQRFDLAIKMGEGSKKDLVLVDVKAGGTYTVLELVNKYVAIANQIVTGTASERDKKLWASLGIDVTGYNSNNPDSLYKLQKAIRKNLGFYCSFVHAGTDFYDTTADYERAWTFGSDGYVLGWDTEITLPKVVNGQFHSGSFSNVKLMPTDDNFDFKSTGLTEGYNWWVLRDQFDRFGIGKTVEIEYEGREGLTGYTYSQSDYDNFIRKSEVGIINGINTAGYVKNNSYDNDTMTVNGVEYALVYGSAGKDKIDMFYMESKADKPVAGFVIDNAYYFPYNPSSGKDYMIVAGDGNDEVDMSAFQGKNIIYGGKGNDILRGGEGVNYIYGDYQGNRYSGDDGGDDTLIAKGEENYLYGGKGIDTYKVSGSGKTMSDDIEGDDKYFIEDGFIGEYDITDQTGSDKYEISGKGHVSINEQEGVDTYEFKNSGASTITVFDMEGADIYNFKEMSGTYNIEDERGIDTYTFNRVVADSIIKIVDKGGKDTYTINDTKDWLDFGNYSARYDIRDSNGNDIYDFKLNKSKNDIFIHDTEDRPNVVSQGLDKYTITGKDAKNSAVRIIDEYGNDIYDFTNYAGHFSIHDLKGNDTYTLGGATIAGNYMSVIDEEGYDIYSLNGKGVLYITDKDGAGEVRLDGGSKLTGGERDPENDPEHTYFGDGKTYYWKGGDLTVDDNLIIRDFKNGDLGINLKTKEGDDDGSGGGNRPSDEKPANTTSPIIIDLNRDGITTSAEGNRIYFDLNANGFAESTGWINAEDGFLVADLNNNQKIDNGRELFGNNTVLKDGSLAANGFEALKEWDSNGDGIINQLDEGWSQLKIWQDKNLDGQTNEGELLSLDEVGIKSIDLNYKEQNKIDASGNEHQQNSTVTWQDGTTSEAVDVWFKVNPTNSLNLEVVHVSKEVALLPNIQAFGNVADLHTAMQKNAALFEKVQAFLTSDFATQKKLLDELIYEWAGSIDVDPYSRDPNKIYGHVMDARQLVALENLIGRDYMGIWCWGEKDPNPHGHAAPLLVDEFYKFANYTHAVLLAESKYSAEFKGILLDQYDAQGQLVYNNTKLTQTLIHLIESQQFDEAQALIFVAQNLSNYDALLKDRIAGVLTQIADISETYKDTLTKITGSILGNASNNILRGTDGDDYIVGYAGNDTLNGGAGNDIYQFDKGFDRDQIYDSSGIDKIIFGIGITLADLRFSRDMTSVYIVRVDQNGHPTNDVIEIRNFFNMDGWYTREWPY